MDDINELSFEAAFAALEEVNARLQSGDLTLEDTVTLVERGRLLSERCQQLLDAAELRIKKLSDSGELSDHQL